MKDLDDLTNLLYLIPSYYSVTSDIWCNISLDYKLRIIAILSNHFTLKMRDVT